MSHALATVRRDGRRPSARACGNEPRAVEVPFFALSDGQNHPQVGYFGQSMRKVAPLGKHVLIRAPCGGGAILDIV